MKITTGVLQVYIYDDLSYPHDNYVQKVKKKLESFERNFLNTCNTYM